MSKIKVIEGAWFLVFEATFCFLYIGMCEVPNWVVGPKRIETCVERYMFTAGLFFPSAVARVKSPTDTDQSKT